MATGVFISRQVKASWGLPCNQSADGSLWAGKGYEKGLEGQFGHSVAQAVRQALARVRGDRCGRFWIDLEERTVTMMVGDSVDNEVVTEPF
ncbi:MAG TPA: hypothetical protein VGU20_15090 [Stellaceae bacterium]|nr:hypothetical protein [Stellaceae bacterium]